MTKQPVLRINLLVGGCTDEQYIEAATRGLNISGWTGNVAWVKRSRRAASVYFENCKRIEG